MKFVSLYIYGSKFKQQLIVQINDQALTIALAQKGDTHLHLMQHQTHVLIMNEIKGPIIYNPTAIQQLIQQFIDQHNIQSTTMAISWPAATTNSITLLQQALCLSKKHPVTKLTTTQLIPDAIPTTHTAHDECPTWDAYLNAPNVLETLLPTGYHALPAWITLSGLALGVIFYGLTSMYTTSQHAISAASTQCAQAIIINTQMQAKAKTVRELTQKNQKLDAQLNLITKHQSCTSAIQAFLITVAQTIPRNSYLVDFAMHNKTEKAPAQVKSKAPMPQKPAANKPTYLHLSLKGVTYNPEEMSIFLKHLSEKIPNGHFALSNIQRITGPQATQPGAKATYAFAINGLIPA